ncbi:MAG: phage tail protein [Acidobacteria bacterium 13_1_20CM_3_53_8]|nr:MAG: phage tail protein [Acidobacteria bacterium 13_1_20CM_3_53_8]
MPDRITPYGAFNFLVDIGGDIGPIGGFSDVSGLSTDIKVAEYRNGNDAENHVRKVPGIHSVADVTLKRGVVSSNDLWAWINDVRVNSINAQRQVVITLRDEAGQPVQAWTLRNVIPLKYTGPTLAAKGGGDVAMEELVLSSEGLILNE